MKALDLFCSAGGVTKGLQRAGFRVTGVDLLPQPRYCGDEFHQADALTFPLEGFDLLWASPPCQLFTVLQNTVTLDHPDLIEPMRARLVASGTPYIIENVPGAPLINPFLLCGTMFGDLGLPTAELRRHRIFETSFSLGLVPRCDHKMTKEVDGKRFGTVTVTGHAGGTRRRGNLQQYTADQRREAMGIDWMTNEELAQAIPPPYAEFLAREYISQIQVFTRL